MKQQRLFGFFHRFTPEGRSESARTSPIHSPKLRLSHHDTASPNLRSSEEEQSHDSGFAVEQHASLDIPHSNPRSRQVSEASSVGSKRSREDDADNQVIGSPTPKAPKVAQATVKASVGDQAPGLLEIPHNEQDAPSSSLTVLSHTPSATSQRPLSFVRSSQDSESDEIEVLPESQHPALRANHAENPDTDEESSDSSLGDLQGFTPKHRRKDKSPSQPPRSPILASQNTQTPNTRRTTRTGAGTVRRQDYYEPHYFDPSLFKEPERSEPVAKFSLARLVKQHKKEAAQEQEIARHLQVLEAAQQEQDAATNAKDTPSRDTLLASLVSSADNEGNAERLKMALGRIEAMKISTRWHFFDASAQSLPSTEAAEFPTWRLAEDPVWRHLCDPKLRTHAFLTGFVLDLLRHNPCPDELRQWFWTSALKEKRDHFAKAYMSAFQACPGNGLASSQFQEALRQMGANESAMSTSGVVRPNTSDKAIQGDEESNKTALFRLPLLLDCTRDLAARMDDETRIAIMMTLLKMGIDAGLIADAAVRVSLQSCMEAIVDTLDEDQEMDHLNKSSIPIFECVKNMSLRAELVAAIPDTSSRLRLFKQRLALAFYLDDAKVLRDDILKVPNLDEAVAQILNHTDVLDESVDYATVAARVSLLDMSIGAGFPLKHTADAMSEEKFNAGIDRVSRSVKQLFARIVDTGASHMARTEAKGTLERLQYRLDFAVRTKPPAKLNIYEDVMVGRGMLQDKKSAAFLSNFLRPTKDVRHAEDGDVEPRPPAPADITANLE